MPTGSRFSCFVSMSVIRLQIQSFFIKNVLCVDKNTSYFAVLSFISFAQKIALNWQPTIRKIFMFIICLRFVFVYLWPRHHKTPSKKYVNINGKVCLDSWRGMLRAISDHLQFCCKLFTVYKLSHTSLLPRFYTELFSFFKLSIFSKCTKKGDRNHTHAQIHKYQV